MMVITSSRTGSDVELTVGSKERRELGKKAKQVDDCGCTSS